MTEYTALQNVSAQTLLSEVEAKVNEGKGWTVVNFTHGSAKRQGGQKEDYYIYTAFLTRETET